MIALHILAGGSAARSADTWHV